MNNSVEAAPGSEEGPPGTPGVLRTVLWTVNDSVTNTSARNGIKLAWWGAAQVGFRVYRSRDDGASFCALLKPEAVGTPPVPALPLYGTVQVGVCPNDRDGTTVGDSNAASTNFSAEPTTFAYWDRTVAGGVSYWYRVTQITTGGQETPLASANEVRGMQLYYEPTILPPPMSFRAWAPQERGTADERGIAVDWCAAPIGVDDPDPLAYPTPVEYRLYRKGFAFATDTFQPLARISKTCLDSDKRCEITTSLQCPAGGQWQDCPLVTPVSCSDTTGPKCRIVDRTHDCWPQTRFSMINQQHYNFAYRVTVVGSSGTPAVVTESMPSVENEGWLNYCVPSYDANGDALDCACGTSCLMSSCIERRDPDGDGDTLVCGEEDAQLDAAEPEDPMSAEPPWCENPTSLACLAPYRSIGLPPVCIECNGGGDPGGGSGGGGDPPNPPNPYNPPARFIFYHADHLGSPRVILDANGALVSKHHYLPFGEERPYATDPTLNNRAFTGHQRDAESGLDYMMARYYSSSLGRFMAVDPALKINKNLVSPQRWNRYTYVLNNPMKFLDPDGQELRLGTLGSITMDALRKSVPAADRGAISVGKNKDGNFIVKVDKNHKSSDLNFSNIQTTANDPRVVEINQTAPSTPIPMVRPDGQPTSYSLSDIGRLGVTLPSADVAGDQAIPTSAQPGVTEVHIDSSLSSYDQAPVVAGELAGHVVPGLQGEGAAPAGDPQHHEREDPAKAQATVNRDQK